MPKLNGEPLWTETEAARTYYKEYQKSYHERRQKEDPEYRERRTENARKSSSYKGLTGEAKQKYIAKVRKAWLKQSYGLTLEQYDEMYEQQRGLCKICHQPERRKYKNGAVIRLAVDHDHGTGVVRGLLCADCNKGLGQFKDNVDRLLEAAAYLEAAKLAQDNVVPIQS